VNKAASKKYRMSFSVGGLQVRESVALVKACRSGETWPEARERLVAEGFSSFPKLASQTRVLREVFDRIGHLTYAERTYLLEEADRLEEQALIWLAVCRTYPFIREFVVEVVSERYQSWRFELGLEAFDRFFAEKAESDQGLAKLSPSTVAKVRQVLFRIMRESGLLNEEGKIQPIWLSVRMKALIKETDPSDLLLFPGNGGHL
jgi:hypothetical protein